MHGHCPKGCSFRKQYLAPSLLSALLAGDETNLIPNAPPKIFCGGRGCRPRQHATTTFSAMRGRQRKKKIERVIFSRKKVRGENKYLDVYFASVARAGSNSWTQRRSITMVYSSCTLALLFSLLLWLFIPPSLSLSPLYFLSKLSLLWLSHHLKCTWNNKLPPDRCVHNLRATFSVDRYVQPTQNLSIDGFRGSKIAKGSVG